MSAASSRALPGAVAATVTVVFWGSAFAGIRAGLHSYSPAHLALLRFLSASAALALITALRALRGTASPGMTRGTASPGMTQSTASPGMTQSTASPGIRLPRLRDVPLVGALGLLGFSFYNIALNIGETTIAAGPAALLIQTLPIWTTLAAIIFLGERLLPLGWVGIGVSFAGAVLIALDKGSGFSVGWGAGLILLASLSASAYNILQKSMLSRYGPVELTTLAIWAGTVLLLPFSGGLVGEMRAAPLADTLAVLYLGVGPAALAYVTWAVVLSRLPASRASSTLFVVPVVAFLSGWVWLGEAPALLDVAGGVLAMGGVAIVNTLGRPRARSTGSHPSAGEAEGAR